ncbi:hypothetical protein WS67_18655 [Burkholderia singularis]|uniref:Uncharacterized protein n=1 Tax=Burkholderia singularis TaxID=1503053 RepID=A0A103DZ00_9BURK|nr:hypothetical protein AQ611_06760 [Burkholderia sp. Bp7605]KVE25292.1 hypothetical protein WS67_18655 [Burkholderia singularis]
MTEKEAENAKARFYRIALSAMTALARPRGGHCRTRARPGRDSAGLLKWARCGRLPRPKEFA